MIRHCVFVKFRDDVPTAEISAIHADLSALRDLIDGMGAVHFNGNVSPEPFARGFTHGFTIDFSDAISRDAYLVHEAHRQAGARLVTTLAGGTDGLMVFDLEFAGD